MESGAITAFFVTGPPRVGKTTLVRKICDKLSEQSKLGFYTEEVRQNGQRIGFDVVTLSGARGILAREYTVPTDPRPKVGKYSVYVEDFEELALPLVKMPRNTQELLIIDEIGKMELISKRFETAIVQLLQQKPFILATIPARARQPIKLVERLRNSSGSRIYQVTKGNRDGLVNDITDDIVKTLEKGK